MRNCSQRVSLLLVGFAIAMIAFAKPEEQLEKVETVSETKVLKADTVYEFSRSVGLGRIKTAVEGKNGSITKIFRLIKKEGKVVGKELVREERIEPVNKKIFLGRGGYTPSRGGSLRGGKVVMMKASAYDPGPHSNGGWAGTTTLGIKPRYGIVAVDPRVIPLGSLVFVEGYGFGYAADTGSAIKGHRIDLCYNTVAECYRFGRKTVRVHILGKAK